MINSAPLRKLSREYYEGQIDRAYYLQQRRCLIVSLAGGHGSEGLSQSTTVPGLFHKLGESQPDANDLAIALASRDDDSSAIQEAVSDRAVFDNLSSALMDVCRTEAPSEQSAAAKPGGVTTQDPSLFGSTSGETMHEAPESPSGSSLTGKLLLVLLLLLLGVWLVWQQP